MRKLRIIVVEDEIIIRKYITGILQDLDCEISGEAATGEYAIDLADSLKPDLIFMDIKLDGNMDGIEASQRICSRYKIPIAFMSAYDYKKKNLEDAIPCCVGYFSKPVEISLLRPLLSSIKESLFG